MNHYKSKILTNQQRKKLERAIEKMIFIAFMRHKTIRGKSIKIKKYENGYFIKIKK